ncbi:MAG: DHH family phosphoesterase, partial [Clostridia bacterium]|nr:DHH family phosphoesterase [Clostridia bacterium]
MERTALAPTQTAIARKLGLSDDFMRILAMRGLDTEDEILSFLRPSLDKMSSPFDIDGMREGAERIKRAILKREKVLIFGDYDCDGIGAISILMLYLRDKLDVKYFIPNRVTDGYGMNVDTLKSLISRRRPDLVITVDCGITASEEVEYLKGEGIDVIVTDHHEPQDVLPDCIVIDPKVKREGFYDFCGAGVALKLVE